MTRALLAAALTAGAVASAVVAIPRAARWLIRVTPIDRCDLMVVLAGGANERLGTAVDLMSTGACPRIMFTGEEPGEQIDHVRLFLEGLDPSLRVTAPSISRSTFQDAVVALRAARARGLRSLLVVTSPYHTRRATWVFARVFAGCGIRFGVYPSSSLYMKYDRWWEDNYGRSAVASEYAKLWLCGLASEAIVAGAATSAHV